MSAVMTNVARVSYEEYCRLEALAETRHDFVEGSIVAMSGGSLSHSRIIAAVTRVVGNRLVGHPCELLESNFRIAFPRRTYSHYPDATIVCGEPQIDPRDPTRQSLTNPKAVIEVLSPSTADFDRGTKFDRYRQLPSLREYIVIFQDRPEVQTSFKQDDGTWLFQTFSGLTAEAILRSVDVTLPLSEIYARVIFEPTAEDASTADA